MGVVRRRNESAGRLASASAFVPLFEGGMEAVCRDVPMLPIRNDQSMTPRAGFYCPSRSRSGQRCAAAAPYSAAVVRPNP